MTTLPQLASIQTTRPIAGQSLALPSPVPVTPQQPPIDTRMTLGDVRRVLRANAWLIVLMVAGGGGGGYALNNWLSQHYSRYTSTGYVCVHTKQEHLADTSDHAVNVNPAELELELGTQARLLVHDRLLTRVLDSSDSIRQTDWFKQFVLYRDGKQYTDVSAAKADLADHLEVTPVSNSRLISVKMTYSVPVDCQTIVNEVVDQHIKDQTQMTSANDVENVQSIEQLKGKCESQMSDINSRMSQISAQLAVDGVGVGQGPDTREFELQQLISEQTRGAALIAATQQKLRSFDLQMKTQSAPELEDALQKSSVYTEYHRAVDELELTYSDLVATEGPGNPRSQAYKRRLDTMRQKLADVKTEVEKRTLDLVRSNFQNDETAATASLQRVNERIGQLRTEIASVAKLRNEYAQLQSDSTNVHGRLDRIKDQQNRLGLLAGNGKWSEVEWQALPDLPDKPTFPKLWATLAVTVMAGLTLSLGIAFFREMTDTTIRTPRDIARVGNLPLLGLIPHKKDDPEAAGARLPLVIFEAPQSILAEQFRHVRTRLQHTTAIDTTRSILVSGCSAEDGITTVACNLAAGLALNGRKILLVDANFRRPDLHNIFGAPNDIGFGDVLNDLDTFHDAVFATEVPNLALISSGGKPSNPTELLESQLLIDFIQRALREYDHVIFDSGPLLMVSDSIALAPRVDGVITVVRARGNSRGMLGRLRDELRRLKAEHLGVVLNAVRVQGGGYYGPMIRDYYAYQNG